MSLCHSYVQWNSTYPDAGYLDQLGPSVKFVENSAKLTCLEITGCQIKCNTMLWLPELRIRHGQKIWMQVHTVNINCQISNCQYSPFKKKSSYQDFLHIQMAYHPK
jgi:hypothetical protein